MNSVRSIAAVLFFIFAWSAHAAKFGNQFVEFELPANWTCVLEGAEWVCQNSDADRKKDAIIVLAAKIQGDQDTLPQYEAYLKNPKTFNNAQGKATTSEVRYAQTKTIQDQPWVDALHLQSEIPGFYTRYLATVKDGIGILVTYSVNKNKYTEYTSQFDSMVKSLKAFRREGGLNSIAAANTDLFKNSHVPSGISSDTVFGNNITGASEDKPKPKGSLLDDPLIFYGGIALVVLVIVTIRKRMKKS